MSSGRDRRAAALAVVAGLTAALAACKGGSPPASSDEVAGSARAASGAPPGSAAGSAAGPAAGPATSSPPVAPPPAPTTTLRAGSNAIAFDEPKIDLPRQESFKLLDAGKSPRAALRYALAQGTTRFIAQATLSSRHLDHGAFTNPSALPAIRDGFAITVAGDRAGKLALLPLAGEAAAASPDADAYLTPWRTLLQNRRITVAFDDRGGFSAITFNDDATNARSGKARDELVQRLLLLIVPLPVEPVGAGASWRVVTILRQGPAYAKQTATYTLTARTPGGWKLHAKLQRVGEEQRITDPALPAGTTADLLAMFRELEGDIEVDPTQPLIIGGALAFESRLHVKLQAPGQSAAQATEQIFEDTGTVALSRER
jgi:hypothetical protein